MRCKSTLTLVGLLVIAAGCRGEAISEHSSGTAKGVTTQGFEATTVPAGWQASENATLHITAERYKDGAQSLRWEGAGARQLTLTDPGAFKLIRVEPNAKKIRSQFGLWVYNEQPAEEAMTLEFLQGDEVVGSCWFWMNYRGWRPLAADYRDAGVAPGQMIDGLRLRAPDPIGTLYLDVVDLNMKRGAKFSQFSYQIPWAGQPGAMERLSEVVVNDADISVNRPWLPKRQTPTKREREDMQTLRERFLPAANPLESPGTGKAIAADDIAALRQRMADYRIQVRDGIRTGQAVRRALILIPGDSVEINQVMALCAEVEMLYRQAADPNQRAELGELFVLLTAHLLDQGFEEGTASTWMNNGYDVRTWPPMFFRMRTLLSEAGLLRETALMLAWYMGCQIPGTYLAEDPHVSMDGLNNFNRSLIPSILLIPDETERLQRLRAVQRYYDLALTHPKTIGPDGCAYHHGMSHFAYASYSMRPPIHAARKLADTTFRFATATQERLKAHVQAMAFASMGGVMAPNFSARAGTPMKSDMSPLARILAECGTPDGREEIDPEMAGLYLALTGDSESEPGSTWRARGITPRPPTGHWTLNGAAGALHRQDNWMVSIFGISRFWTGLEIYGWTKTNNYARYARNGSICVVTRPEPDAPGQTGWSAPGWNWCHWPGTTSLVRPALELFAGYSWVHNKKGFSAGTQLGADGIWGMDFKVDDANYQEDDVNFRKSAFCFGNRITVITTGIESKVEDRPAVTTLFQNHTDTNSDVLWINGERASEFPLQLERTGDQPVWLIDNRKVGYILPAQHDTLHVQRQKQSWTYMIDQYLIDPNDNPIINYRARKYRHKSMAENEKYFKPSFGDFALAYIDHGTMPTGASSTYTMVMGATPDTMPAIVADPPYSILQQNNQAHILYDRPTDTTAYALFNPQTSINHQSSILRSASQPCYVMIRREGSGLHLSVVSPDIKITEPIQLRLKGSWKLDPPARAKNISVTCEQGGHSLLELLPASYMPTEFRLKVKH